MSELNAALPRKDQLAPSTKDSTAGLWSKNESNMPVWQRLNSTPGGCQANLHSWDEKYGESGDLQASPTGD